MNLRKASMYLFVSIFVVCAAKLFVMIKINELSSEVSQLNEEIKFHEKEIQELQGPFGLKVERDLLFETTTVLVDDKINEELN